MGRIRKKLQTSGYNFILLLATLGALGVGSLEVYDCAAEHTTYEVINLLETDSCPEQQKKYQEPTMKRIQVLHSEGKRRLLGLVCRIVETRAVTVCDAAWHYTSNYQFPVWRQPVIVSGPDCRKMSRRRNGSQNGEAINLT